MDLKVKKTIYSNDLDEVHIFFNKIGIESRAALHVQYVPHTYSAIAL